METNAERKAPNRSQWRLSTLLMLMFGVAVVSGFVVNLRSNETIEATFFELPNQDVELQKWTREVMHVPDAKIVRTNDGIRLKFQRQFYRAFGIPHPPWDQFGYLGLRTIRYQSGSNLNLFLVFWVGAAVVALLFKAIQDLWRMGTRNLPDNGIG